MTASEWLVTGSATALILKLAGIHLSWWWITAPLIVCGVVAFIAHEIGADQ
jgi:hypothetical protein